MVTNAKAEAIFLSPARLVLARVLLEHEPTPCQVSAFPDGWFVGPYEPAIELCGECPVRAECLAYAVDADAWGIWGGTTEQERRQLRREARKVPA